MAYDDGGVEDVVPLYLTLVEAVREGGEVRLEALTAMLGMFQEEEKRRICLAPTNVDIVALLVAIVKVSKSPTDL